MSDDVEFQVWLSQRPPKLVDLTDKKTSVVHIILTPVIRKDIERVLIAVTRWVLPFTFLIAAPSYERVDQAFVDLSLRKELNDLYGSNYVARNKIVVIAQRRGDRQANIVIA